MPHSFPPHRRHPILTLFRALPLFMAVLLLVVASTAFPQLQEPGDQAAELATTRNAMDRWVETRRLISSTVSEWAEGRQLLEERIAMLDREILAIADRSKEATEEISKTNQQLEGLREDQEELKSAAVNLSALVGGFEARTLSLLQRLPEPLAQRLKPLSQGIPRPGEDSGVGLARRFQNIIGILDAVNKFQREVTSSTEIRQLADGSSSEVTVLYLGISMAYYASADGKLGCYGIPGEAGWIWQEANQEAPAIARAVAIYANSEKASFVLLPATLDRITE